MSVLVAFSVTPLGVGEGVGEIVAEAVRVVRESGLPNKTDSMFTVIEGDTWAEVMAVVQHAVEAVAARASRVSVVIKADWRSGVTDAMTSENRIGGAPPVESPSAAPSVVAVSARAGIVVTGTEVLTGRVADRNGPWLADRLLELGVELAHITICGDRAADIDAQLRFMADEGVDLIVTSGGLGPTADDMTVATVARFCGLELALDAELENKIAVILKKLMSRIGSGDFDAVRAANRKQAMVPVGAVVMDPVGTAPGVVVPGKPTVVVLPGPPRELQPMWQTASRDTRRPGRHRRPHDLPPRHHQNVRAAGIRAGRDTPRGGGRRARFRLAGDHHVSAARGDRDGHALRTRHRRRVPTISRIPPRPALAADLLRRRLHGGRAGGAAAHRAPDRDGGVVHRRTAGGTAHRPARFVGLPAPVGWWPTPMKRKPTCSAWIRN